MDFVRVSTGDEGVATVTLSRGKVNAVTGEVVAELAETFHRLERDSEVRAAVLTGHGSFFSFGFDVPHFMDYTPQAFTDFLTAFTSLYAQLAVFPKPLVMAINGHAVAGGAMLALAGDERLVAAGKAKLALHEVSFGAAVFAGSVALLEDIIGHRRAERVLLGGAMYDPGQAFELGLVDGVLPPEVLIEASRQVAAQLGAKPQPAFATIKRMLRKRSLEVIERDEAASIERFVEIWYTDETRAFLRKIIIR